MKSSHGAFYIGLVPSLGDLTEKHITNSKSCLLVLLMLSLILPPYLVGWFWGRGQRACLKDSEKGEQILSGMLQHANSLVHTQ